MSDVNLTTLTQGEKVLCWDFDKTLVQGKNALIFRKFVMDNLDKEHHIITFRNSSAGMLNYLNERMGWNENAIKSIVTLPPDLVDNFYRWNGRGMQWASEAIKNGNGNSRRYPNDNATAFDIVEAVEKAYEFKALATKSLGARILVDDYYYELLPHFKKHGLCLVDSLGDISV